MRGLGGGASGAAEAQRPSERRVADLEALRLGVEGKAAGWQTLRKLSTVDERLDAARLDTLIERARRQQETIEEWRVRQIEQALTTTGG